MAQVWNQPPSEKRLGPAVKVGTLGAAPLLTIKLGSHECQGVLTVAEAEDLADALDEWLESWDGVVAE